MSHQLITFLKLRGILVFNLNDYKSRFRAKKILRKVHKNWLVISLALLMALGGSAFVSQASDSKSVSGPAVSQTVVHNSWSNNGNANSNRTSPKPVNQNSNQPNLQHPASDNSRDSSRQTPVSDANLVPTLFNDFNFEQLVNNVNNDTWYQQNSSSLHRLVNTDLTPQNIRDVCSGWNLNKTINLVRDFNHVVPKPNLTSALNHLTQPGGFTYNARFYQVIKYGGPLYFANTPQYSQILGDLNTIIGYRNDNRQIMSARDISNQLDSNLIRTFLGRLKDTLNDYNHIEFNYQFAQMVGNDLVSQLKNETGDQINENTNQIVGNFRSQVQTLNQPNQSINSSSGLIPFKVSDLLSNQVVSFIKDQLADSQSELNQGPSKLAVDRFITDLRSVPNDGSAQISDYLAKIKDDLDQVPALSTFDSMVSSWQAANNGTGWTDLIDQLKDPASHNLAALIQAAGSSSGASTKIGSDFENVLNTLAKIHTDACVGHRSNALNLDSQNLGQGLKTITSDLQTSQFDLTPIGDSFNKIQTDFQPKSEYQNQ